MKKDITAIKEILEKEKALLITELESVGKIKNSKNPDDWQATPTNLDIQESDPNEVADRIESYEGNTSIVNNLEKRLSEIDAALKKISENAYGVCEVCGKEIEEDRLEANPAAKTCKEHMH